METKSICFENTWHYLSSLLVDHIDMQLWMKNNEIGHKQLDFEWISSEWLRDLLTLILKHSLVVAYWYNDVTHKKVTTWIAEWIRAVFVIVEWTQKMWVTEMNQNPITNIKQL